MGTESTASIITYLRSLAPEFFAARMQGASEAEILRLEQVAGLRMSDGHREFLRALGTTPARVLNPFLNDRDFCIETLVAEYEDLRREEITLPPNVVYFSSSELTGSNLFLRQAEDPSGDPEIGDLAPKTNEFQRVDEQHLESYLRWHAFRFRMNQLDHELLVRPRWNSDEGRWERDRSEYRELLEAQALVRRFSIDDSTECFERDGVVVALCPDGSMGMAGDDGHPNQARHRGGPQPRPAPRPTRVSSPHGARARPRSAHIARERRLTYPSRPMSRAADLFFATLSMILICACDSSPASETTKAESSNESAAKTGDAAKTGAAAKPPAKTGDAKPDAKEKPAESTGVSITLTVNDKTTTVELSQSIIAARGPDSGLAAWACVPQLGKASIVDFSIGDDPARKGELFVATIEPKDLVMVAPGKSIAAMFQYRSAGEPTPKNGTGTMVWDEGMTSGSAEGKGDNGDTLSAKWTCATAAAD